MNELIEEKKVQRPIVWMFSGQGTQYFQMGRYLYFNNTTFRYWMDKLDAIALNYVSQSIIAILYDSAHTKNKIFNQILYTHPALFMVQYAMAKTLLAEGFSMPNYLFGASLGEFVAATLADVIDVEIMLFDIIRQAHLFKNYCNDGGMLLVMDNINNFYTNPIFNNSAIFSTAQDNVELAGINFEHCFLVSGLKNKIQKVIKQLHCQNIAHQLLPISIAFHSSFIDNIKDIFNNTFCQRIIRTAKIPILSCATIINTIDPFSVNYLWQIVRQPIKFRQALLNFDKYQNQALYLDLSPTGTMANFTKYNLQEQERYRVMSIMTPFDKDFKNIQIIQNKLQLLSTIEE